MTNFEAAVHSFHFYRQRSALLKTGGMTVNEETDVMESVGRGPDRADMFWNMEL